MPLYAVIGFDHEPHSMALRDQHRAEHRGYVLDNDAPLRLAGAMYADEHNQSGTLLIFEAASAEEVWQWVRGEAFYRNGVYRDFRVIEWRMALNRLQPMEWAVSRPVQGQS